MVEVALSPGSDIGLYPRLATVRLHKCRFVAIFPFFLLEFHSDISICWGSLQTKVLEQGAEVRKTYLIFFDQASKLPWFTETCQMITMLC